MKILFVSNDQKNYTRKNHDKLKALLGDDFYTVVLSCNYIFEAKSFEMLQSGTLRDLIEKGEMDYKPFRRRKPLNLFQRIALWLTSNKS